MKDEIKCNKTLYFFSKILRSELSKIAAENFRAWKKLKVSVKNKNSVFRKKNSII